MRSEYLKYLIEIDKQNSISAAANELYLGTSTLNGIVKSVEEELGFRLFQRARSGVQPTAEGEEALAIIWEINRCFEEISEISPTSPRLQPVPVVISHAFNGCLPLPLNMAFLEKEPAGNLLFHAATSDEVGQRIIKNDANIGITYFFQEDLETFRSIASRYQVNVEVLCRDSLYLLVSRDHPLAGRDTISCRELQDLTFARLPSSTTSGDLLAYFKVVGPGNRFAMFSDVALIKKAVLRQNMVALLNGYAIHHNQSVDNSRFKAIRLEETDRKNELFLCLIHRTDSNLRYPEKVFTQCVRDYFAALEPFEPADD